MVSLVMYAQPGVPYHNNSDESLCKLFLLQFLQLGCLRPCSSFQLTCACSSALQHLDFLCNIPYEQRQLLRQLLISMVLATDMQQHFALTASFGPVITAVSRGMGTLAQHAETVMRVRLGQNFMLAAKPAVFHKVVLWV